MSSYPDVLTNGVFFFLLFVRQILFFLFFNWDIRALGDPAFPAKKTKTKNPFVNGCVGARRTRVPKFSVYLQKMA